eukprot:3510057-Pyramimonas_sp.AAC.1
MRGSASAHARSRGRAAHARRTWFAAGPWLRALKRRNSAPPSSRTAPITLPSTSGGEEAAAAAE